MRIGIWFGGGGIGDSSGDNWFVGKVDPGDWLGGGGGNIGGSGSGGDDVGVWCGRGDRLGFLHRSLVGGRCVWIAWGHGGISLSCDLVAFGGKASVAASDNRDTFDETPDTIAYDNDIGCNDDANRKSV